MKTGILKIAPILFIIAWTGILNAQTITTSTATITSCPGTILVPINVTNCNGVGAISLVLSYNNSLLTYMGYQNINTALTSGFLIVNSNNSKVFISWISTTPANVGNGTLMHLRFNVIPGTSNLVWDTLTSGNCEYTNPYGQIIPSFYHNSIITIVTNTMNVSAGDDITITPGGSAQLNGSVGGGTAPYNYLWTPATWLSNPSIPNPQASPPSMVTYTFNVTDNNNCIASDHVTVIVSIPVTRTWTGAVDEKWNTAGNWNPVGVPGGLDDVIIPMTIPFMPVVKFYGLSCNNIFIQPGAILTIDPGYVLSVNGEMTIEGQ